MTKNITYQQALKYLVPDRIIKSYGEVVNKPCELLDTISGTTAWCDFKTDSEWGEFTFMFQADLLAKFYNQNLYKINIAEVETQYGIKIDSRSIPVFRNRSTCGYPVRSKEAISKSLEKKFCINYAFQENGYSEKGILLIGILDTSFEGFVCDRELQAMNVLEEIQQEFKGKFQKSCFKEVVLIDALADPKLNPSNSVFRLFPTKNPLQGILKKIAYIFPVVPNLSSSYNHVEAWYRSKHCFNSATLNEKNYNGRRSEWGWQNDYGVCVYF